MRLRACLALAIAACLPFAATVAHGEDIALVIANPSDGGSADRTDASTAILTASERLADAGVAVVSGSASGARQMNALFSQIEQMAPSAEALAVVLSGRFVHSPTETYFLPAGLEGAALSGLARESMPMSSVLALLGRMPGRAVLALAPGGRDGALGPFLHRGIGALDLPQGVTLVTGTPQDVARLMRTTLATAGAPMAAGVRAIKGLEISGFVPETLAFLPREGGDGGAALKARLARAEAEAAEARRTEQQLRDRLSGVERSAWSMAEAEGTADAYRRYLDLFAQGANSAAARQRLEDLRVAPLRAAQRAEELLGLSRPQRQAIQRDLTTLGFNTRGVDGIFGQGTRTAIGNWQRDRRLEVNGYLDRAQIRQLSGEAAARRRDREDQAEAEQQRQDRAFWGNTGEAGGEAGLRRYLERYPDGVFAARARAELAAIEAARGSAEAEEERLAWRRVTQQNTAEGYRQFLNAFPNGVYSADARTRLQELDRPDPALEQARAEEEALGLTPVLRRTVEARLDVMKLNPGPVDGNFETSTRRALRQYQANEGLAQTGYLDQATAVRLLANTVRDFLR